jgi:hypothetical protein
VHGARRRPIGASLPDGGQSLNDVVLVLAIAAIAAAAGIGLGIVVVAPRITRALDRADESDDNDEAGPEAVEDADG